MIAKPLGLQGFRVALSASSNTINHESNCILRVAILQKIPSLKITQTLIKLIHFEDGHVIFVKRTQIPSQKPHKTISFALLRTCEPRRQTTL